MASAALGVIVVAGLYWAQPIFIPLALAVFLTFILAPVVNTLQQWWLGRTPAVIVTVLLATAVLVGIGWVVSYQVSGLIDSLKQPKYAENIGRKLQTVQGWMQGGLMADVREFVREVEKGAKKDAKGDAPPAPSNPDQTPKIGETKAGTPQPPVVAEQPSTVWYGRSRRSDWPGCRSWRARRPSRWPRRRWCSCW